MKINEAVARHNRATATVKQRVLAHIQGHPDEVFTYRDEDLLRAVGANRTGLNFALWSLSKDGDIDAHRADGRVYFGTPQAIGALKSRLGGLEWIRRGSENRDRIFKEHGNIDTLQLLEEVRQDLWE